MPPNDPAGQKTEKPTRRKRQRAREQGMVAQSMEVNNALVLLAAVGALALFGGYTFQVMAGQLAARLGRLYGPELTLGGARGLLCDSLKIVAGAAAPVMIMAGLAGLICSLAQTGITFAPKKLVPDLSLINPVTGLKNIFSLRALARLILSVAKLIIIALIVFFLVRSRVPWFLALIGKSAWGVLYVSRRICLSMALRIVAAMMGVAVVDYAYQRWSYEKQLMMTKTEVREEHKRDEGDPEVKARQEQVRRTIARSRMMQAVPEADVVVTNPTHIALALRWAEGEMGAPQVVAKGRNWLAEKIKQIAREHAVPVIERKLLAQALYEAVEVGTEIPPKLYYAVAEVLAFVMKKGRP